MAGHSIAFLAVGQGAPGAGGLAGIQEEDDDDGARFLSVPMPRL